MLDREKLEEIQTLARKANYKPDDSCLAANLVEACDSEIIEEMAKEILSLRAVLAPQLVPVGWALVPIEPTPEMIAAAMDSDDVTFDKNDETLFYVHFDTIYAAMVSSAPKPGKGK